MKKSVVNKDFNFRLSLRSRLVWGGYFKRLINALPGGKGSLFDTINGPVSS